MKVIAVIARPAVIWQLLAHLGLPTAAPNRRLQGTRRVGSNRRARGGKLVRRHRFALIGLGRAKKLRLN